MIVGRPDATDSARWWRSRAQPCLQRPGWRSQTRETGPARALRVQDDSVNYGATCIYSSSGRRQYKLTQIVVKAPSLWWPDTDSGNNREHGKVCWELIGPDLHSRRLWTMEHAVHDTRADQDRVRRPARLTTRRTRRNLATWTLNINGVVQEQAKRLRTRGARGRSGSNGDARRSGTVTHEQFYYKWQDVSGPQRLDRRLPDPLSGHPSLIFRRDPASERPRGASASGPFCCFRLVTVYSR